MALPYASKVADLLDALGLPRRPAVNDERAGALLADIDRLWDGRAEQQELLRCGVERMQQLARHTVPLALEPIRQILERRGA
jgi:hypothetical protein